MNYRFPLYCFFLTTAYLNVLWIIDPVKMLNPGFQWGVVLIYLALMIAAVRHRFHHLPAGQTLTLSGILKTAVIVAIAGTVGFHLTQFLYAKLQPEIFQAAQLENIERVVEMVQSLTGDQDREVDMETLAEAPQFRYSFGMFLLGLGQGVIGDFLLAFLVALVMRR